MSETTAIEWCDSTFNPWIGCTEVGPGCDHCYAKDLMQDRYKRVVWGAHQERVRTQPANWHQPVKWNAAHSGFFKMHGRRRRVFCASLADVFDNEVDPAWRLALWELIASTPDLDWLLLTKRIGNVNSMLPVMNSKQPGYRPWHEKWPWRNVWLGVSVVNQEEADRDIPKLIAVPAQVRFLSVEPMLGPVDLRLQRPTTDADRQDLDGWCHHITTAAGAGISWVVCGGESGKDARPMHSDWPRAIRDQCATAGVPFLFKQWGEWLPAMQDRQSGGEGPAHQRQ